MHLNNKKKIIIILGKSKILVKRKKLDEFVRLPKGLRNLSFFYRFFLSIKKFRTPKKFSVVKLLLVKKRNILMIIIYK